MSDDDLFRRFLAEMKQPRPLVKLEISAPAAWVLLGFLQLVLRHPEAGAGESALVAERVARHLQSLIAPPGSAMEEVAERGWEGE